MKKIIALATVMILVAFAAPVFAADPFADVPLNSWAYDAIRQLSASGIISGYSDDTFKGNRLMTRYEMVSIVARVLAAADMNKIDKQDMEILKKLVAEFGDELDVLGIKANDLDSRMAVMEEDLGGWKLAGGFRFDYSGFDNPENGLYAGRCSIGEGGGNWNDRNSNLSRARFHFYKTINRNVEFYGRIGGETPCWQRYRIDVKFPHDILLRVGKSCWNWERDLYWVSPPGSWQTNAIMSHCNVKGFQIMKDIPMGFANFVLGRNDASASDDEYLLYGADFDFNVDEKLRLQLAYVGIDPEYGGDLTTCWIAPKVEFGNGWGLKGAFYQQDNDRLASVNDDARLWKAILTVDRSAAKFSGFWVEYMDAEKGFYFNKATAYDFAAQPGTVLKKAGCGLWQGYYLPVDVDVFQIMGTQKWNEKWDTWFRYAYYDFDTYGDAGNYSVGVDYLYSDAVRFELLYDKIDSDEDTFDDSAVNFRIAVYF